FHLSLSSPEYKKNLPAFLPPDRSWFPSLQNRYSTAHRLSDPSALTPDYAIKHHLLPGLREYGCCQLIYSLTKLPNLYSTSNLHSRQYCQKDKVAAERYS